MACCDLCGKQCKAQDLEQVLHQYQTGGVVDICPACSKWATGIKRDMMLEIPDRMKAAIVERKGNPPLPWWRRMLRSRIKTQPKEPTKK